MNYLFDTKFDVMNGDKRAQTTHGKTLNVFFQHNLLGVWLAIEPRHNTIILDVEGSDGRERGEDKVIFST